jgi:putative flippase GtrA
MQALVAGDFSGEPESELVFASRLIAIPMSALYSVLPTLPWYSAALTGTIVVIASLVLVSARTRIEVLVWFPFLVLVVAYTALRPDFTFVATLGVAMSSMAYALFVRAGPSQRPQRLHVWVGFSLLLAFFALLWRPQAGALALLVILPLLILLFHVSKHLWIPLLPVAFAGLAYVVSAWLRFTGNMEWRAWLAYNQVRGQLHSSRLDFADAYGSLANWSANEIAIFEGFLVPDEWVFSQSRLERLNEVLPVAVERPAADLPGILLSGFTDMFAFWQVWVIAILGSAVILGVRAVTWKPFIAMIVASTAYWTMVLLVVQYVRLPSHLHFPLSLGMALILLSSSMLIEGKNSTLMSTAENYRKVMLAALWLACAAMVFTMPFALAQKFDQGRGLKASVSHLMEQLDSEAACTSYVASAWLSSAAMAHPYGTNPYYSQKILNLGWSSMSPAWNQRKERLGIGLPVLAHLGIRRSEILKPGGCFIGSREQASLISGLMSDLGYGYFVPVSQRKIVYPWNSLEIWRFYEAGVSGV